MLCYITLLHNLTETKNLKQNKRAEENVDGGKGSVLITINGKTTRHRRAIKTFINKCMYEDHVNVI